MFTRFLAANRDIRIVPQNLIVADASTQTEEPSPSSADGTKSVACSPRRYKAQKIRRKKARRDGNHALQETENNDSVALFAYESAAAAESF
jgi:hypothetical protein